MKELSITSRIIVAFTSGALIVVFFLPAWRIDLFAPQYPEGLTLNIWINGLSGDVDIINGLNHYIGMKHITVAMFPEFKFLPYVVIFFILLGILVAISGRIKFLLVYLVLTALGGALAMIDFYNWGYDYGHNLDPKAPIQVPGLSYQPPLLGHKRLLNFDAYSFPDVGGWVVIGAAMIAFSVWFYEWYRHHKLLAKKIKSSPALLALIALLPFISSCKTSPVKFNPGKDNCQYCRMSIMDTRFGGQIISKKGKIYLFDDMHCVSGFLKEGSLNEKDIDKKLTVLFDQPNEFRDISDCWFMISGENKSPMGSNAAAFSSKEKAMEMANEKHGTVIKGEQLMNDLK